MASKDWMNTSGYEQIQKELAANRAAQAGPPAPVPAPPTPDARGFRGVTVNPTPNQLQREGALRPQSGPWSLTNPQPQRNALWELVRPNVADIRPQSVRTAGTTGGPAGNPAQREAGTIAAAAPTLATVTPQTAANAADISRFTRTGVNAGVSTTAPTSTAVSDSGRALGYGRRIDGVNVFSDGSGGPGAPAATMTRPQIESLAQRNVVQSVVPAPGVAASMASGGRSTPDWGQLTRPTQDAVFNMPNAQTRSMQDLGDFMRGDSRSAAGRAGRQFINAARPSGFTTRASRRAVAEAGADVARGIVAGGQQQAVANTQAGTELQREAMRGQNDLAVAGLNANTELTRTAMSRPAPQPVELADGTMGTLGPDNIMRPVLNEQGQPARRAQQQDGNTAKARDALAKAAADLLAGSMQPGQAPTQEQIFQARLQAAQLSGYRTATGPNGQRMVEINGELLPL